jgi:hypothetical protein
MTPKAKADLDNAPAGASRRMPTTEEIAIRAYELYQSRGGSDGTDLDDWLQAERELTGSHVGDS